MKKLLIILLLVVSNPSYAFIRGINYDPVHSPQFAYGMGTDNQAAMHDAIIADLNHLKTLEEKDNIHITHLKTFYTGFASLHNTAKINMADVVSEWNQANPNHALKLALGVYEFRQGFDGCASQQACVAWTSDQIEQAEAALLKQADLIDTVVVGNEDLNSDGIPQRLTQDIQTLKNFLKAHKFEKTSVGTAQTSDSVMKLLSGSDYPSVFNAADFIGVNVYPFWSGVPYAAAKKSFAAYWAQLKAQKNWGKKPVIETEEGWPSAGDQRANRHAEHDYFYYWYYGHNATDGKSADQHDQIVPTSYFFALNDKLPGQGIESHWGLMSADNSSSIFDASGKVLGEQLVFPTFQNAVGADVRQNVVYNLQDPHPVIVTACTQDNGEGQCFPLYGFNGSGHVDAPKVDKNSWSPQANGYIRYTPGESRDLMIDTSGKYYKSLFVILDVPNQYSGVCKVDFNHLKALNSETKISLVWPESGVPGSCPMVQAMS